MEEGFLRPRPAERADDRTPLTKVVAKGLARFGAIVAAGAALSVGLALLVGWWRDSDPWRAATLGLYLGGACLIAVPVFSWGGRTYSSGGYQHYEVELDPAAKRAWQAQLGVYVAVGLALIGLGVALEALHG